MIVVVAVADEVGRTVHMLLRCVDGESEGNGAVVHRPANRCAETVVAVVEKEVAGTEFFRSGHFRDTTKPWHRHTMLSDTESRNGDGQSIRRFLHCVDYRKSCHRHRHFVDRANSTKHPVRRNQFVVG